MKRLWARAHAPPPKWPHPTKEPKTMIQADLNVILPEIVISVYAMLALLGAVYTGKDRLSGALTWLTAAVMALVAMWIALSGQGTNVAFGGMFHDDGFAR